MLVDWLKHAFITKFNHIRPSVYERYIDVLCRDLASMSAVGRRSARKVFMRTRILCNGTLNAFFIAFLCRTLAFCLVDWVSLPFPLQCFSSSLVLSRYGYIQFTSFFYETVHKRYNPLLLSVTLDMDIVDSVVEKCRDHAVILAMVRNLTSKFKRYRQVIYPPLFLSLSFVVIKSIIGVNLLGYATRRRAGMEEREAKDVVNDFGRDPIGEGKEEQVRFLCFLFFHHWGNIQQEIEETGRRRKRWCTSHCWDGREPGWLREEEERELTRYTVVKRLW